MIPDVQDGTISEPQQALASVFANGPDIDRYTEAIANGATEEEALRVGDNGRGAWGDDTTSTTDPIVALPADMPGVYHNRLVQVTGPKGTVVARIGDKGPSGRIDLNPAAALAVGHPGGVVPVQWSFLNGSAPSIPNTSLGSRVPISLMPSQGAASAIPEINLLDTANEDLSQGQPSLADENAPSSGVVSTDSYEENPSAVEAPDQASEDSGAGATGSVQKFKVTDFPPPPPGKIIRTNADGTIVHDNGVIADPKTHSIEWSDGHGNTLKYYGGDGVEIIKGGKSNKATMEEAAARNGFLPTDPKYKGDYQAFVDDWKAFHPGGIDAQDIADSVKAGIVPPLPQYWGGRTVAGKVGAALAKDKFNTSNAALEYSQAQKLIGAGLSPQVIRTRAGAESANLALDLADKLASEWKAGQFAPLNRAQLTLAENGGLGLSPEKAKIAADLAHRLLAQVGEATAQMGSVMQGSPSISGEVLKVAQTQLSGDWDENSFHNAVAQAKENMQYRLAGYNAALSGSPGSMYGTPAAGTQGASSAVGTSATPTPSATPSIQDNVRAAATRILADPNATLGAKAKAQRALDKLGP